jgi:hypothetical protein
MLRPHEPASHARAHPSEADDAQLHDADLPSRKRPPSALPGVAATLFTAARDKQPHRRFLTAGHMPNAMTFIGVNSFTREIVLGAVRVAAVAVTIDRSKLPIVK